MKKLNVLISIVLFFQSFSLLAQSGDTELKISGNLLTDQRMLLNSTNDWAWNENRLTLDFEKKINGSSHFYSDIWLRNIGLPSFSNLGSLYNKGSLDPYNLEIREAYVEVYSFLFKNMDLKIGRQRIAWGTADKMNPTDNLNPYDFEDLFDFGRHRGSDAINLNYYLNNEFSVQGVFIPFYAPANLPIGIFSNVFSTNMVMPAGMSLKGYSTNIIAPELSLSGSSQAAFKFKGRVKAVDFSLSYIWGIDGFPTNTYNVFIPVDTIGGFNINSTLEYTRQHIFGADLSTDIGGVGVWAEVAAFLPQNNVILTNDLTALYPQSPVLVLQDSLLIGSDKPYVKFCIGADYNFSNGIYFNVQYLHGFVHESGNDALNDYIFIGTNRSFLNDKLKIAPISGAFIISNWDDLNNNYAYVWMPEIGYKATGNAEIDLSAAFIGGEGDNMFVSLEDYNMVMLKLKYSF